MKINFYEEQVKNYFGKEPVYFRVPLTPIKINELFLKNKITEEDYDIFTHNYRIQIKRKNNNFERYKELKPHQNRTVNYCVENQNNALGIFDEMRTGKTPTTVKILESMNLLSKHIVMALPTSTIKAWEDELNKWAGVKAKQFEGLDIDEGFDTVKDENGKIKDIIYHTKPKEIRNAMKEWCEKHNVNILLCTYKRIELSYRAINLWGADVVVIDEAHVLSTTNSRKQSNANNKANKAILDLAYYADYRYALTGTPSSNKPHEIFSILQFLFPKDFTAFWNFAEYFFITENNGFGREVKEEFKTPERELELQMLLDLISVKTPLKEANPWIKEPKLITAILEPSPKQLELKETLELKNFIEGKFVTSQLEAYTQLVSLDISPKMFKPSNENGPKFDWIINYINTHEHENIVIYSTRTQALQKLANLLSIEVRYYTGDQNITERRNVEKWANNGDGRKIILASIKAVQVGVKLEGIQTEIFLDESWNPVEMEQCRYRIYATTEEIQKKLPHKKEIHLLINKMISKEVIRPTLETKGSQTERINKYKEYLNKYLERGTFRR